IAELGCSSGPNARLVVSHILETIYNKHCESGSVMPEILVFLNDLPGDDFNTLFKDVGSFCDELRKTKGDGFGPCLVAGMPGTFYGRLFPSDTLHIVHSSYSLQWLSQVPQGTEKTNKGNFCIAKSSPPSVITAYTNQFKKDFRMFLECRSEELEKFDSFNIPAYFPSPGEVKSVIESEGSLTINQLETFHVDWDGCDPKGNENSMVNKLKSSHQTANILRAVSEPLLANRFGEEIMDKLYGRFRERIAEYATTKKTEFTNLVISMTKVGKRSNSCDIIQPV
ncbi:hypothetical protein MKX01_000358, partial [Papaver californicum]